MAHRQLEERHQDASAPCRAATSSTLDIARRRVLRAARPDRRRQDDDAAPDRRAREAGRRARSSSTARTSPTGAPPSATWRWCFQHYSLYPRYTVRAEPRIPAEVASVRTLPRRRDRRARRARRQDAAHRASARPQDRPAVGRRDAARLDRPRHRARAARLPDGRAAVQPRRQAARGAARRAQGPADEARRDLPLRHPRPDRGDVDGRPIGVLNQRPHRPGRHAARDLQRAARHLRRELRRLAGDEPGRRRAPRRARSSALAGKLEVPLDGAGGEGAAAAR